jgi:hypothetical protein
MEHLQLTETRDAIRAEGTVLGVAGAEPFHLTYQLEVDGNWCVRACHLQLSGAADRTLGLSGDGMGHWTDAAGNPLPALDGCIDMDISVTPFTNTLPIRRLALAPGESREILVAYVSVPDLSVRPVQQRYANLARTQTGGTYRYEGLESGFRADLQIDAQGLMLDYSGIWQRVGMAAR